jgi:DNA-binding NarL/FixJ family response regulator
MTPTVISEFVIEAILLASEDWSSAMIAQALRLHQTTVDNHISEFLNKSMMKSVIC